jgi:hypothetical protein
LRKLGLKGDAHLHSIDKTPFVACRRVGSIMTIMLFMKENFIISNFSAKPCNVFTKLQRAGSAGVLAGWSVRRRLLTDWACGRRVRHLAPVGRFFARC